MTGLQFSSPTEMITCAMDCTMKVWDVEVGGFTNNLSGGKPFLDLSFSALNNLVLTANADRHVRLWDTRSKEGERPSAWASQTKSDVRLWRSIDSRHFVTQDQLSSPTTPHTQAG